MQAGDVVQIGVLVDKLVMPHVNFRRMTASAVGPGWRKATPEQQQRLQQEFKTLLVPTYAGAFGAGEERNHQRQAAARPAHRHRRAGAHRSRGRAEPVSWTTAWRKPQAKVQAGKSDNLNVMGVWLVETSRNQFTQRN